MENNNSVKKYLLSGTVLAVFALYAIHLKTDVEKHPVVAIRTAEATPTAVPAQIPVAVGPTPVPSSTPESGMGMMNGQMGPKMMGKYKDGTYTGSVADAFYGNVQVEAVIKNGRIADVKFLQYPNEQRTSIEINQQAMPYLTQEAIQAQSAQVDGVSGATQTSRAFIESLQSALGQAV